MTATEPTPRFETMLAQLKATATTRDELELLGLFEKHIGEVQQHYEGCVPALDGSDYWKYTPQVSPLNEFHGPMFHKGFRAWDVITGDRGEADSRIWNLLAGGDVGAFWRAHAASMQT